MKLSRRRLILSGFVLGSLSGCFGKKAEAWDLIVIGAGAAGLSAAIAASEEGLKVLLLEKMAHVGGNTRISGGFFACVDPVRQNKQGIKDSEAFFLKQIQKSGGGRADLKLDEVLVHQAGQMLAWLEEHGMKFAPTVSEVYGSHWPRSHKPLMSNGEGYIRTLLAVAGKLDVTIKTRMAVKGLLKDETGRVNGVTVISDGRELIYRSRAGVVVATGGFSANPKMIRQFAPKYAGLTTNNMPGATGEMLLAARDIGAQLIDMDLVLCNPGSPPGRSTRARFHMLVNQFIFVNENGRRFIREDDRRDCLTAAVLAQPGRYAYTLIDFNGFKNLSPLMQKEAVLAVETGDAWSGKTIRDLANKMKVPVGALEETIAEYNFAVRSKRDPLGKAADELTHFIAEPPFWACYSGMAIHSTMGGIRISTRAEALQSDGVPVPGLWAAGEAAGGVHGVNRMGGNGISDALVFGRIAGKEAARRSKTKV